MKQSLNQINGARRMWMMMSDNMCFKETKKFEGKKDRLGKSKRELRGIKLLLRVIHMGWGDDLVDKIVC